MKQKPPVILFGQLGHCRHRQTASAAEGTDQVLRMCVFGSQWSRLLVGFGAEISFSTFLFSLRPSTRLKVRNKQGEVLQSQERLQIGTIDRGLLLTFNFEHRFRS